MYYWQENDIKITKKSKILIGLGDSYTQGEGACSVDMWEKYEWDIQKLYKDENVEVLKSSYENSWVNQICKNYLIDYIPINLGVKGTGNRSACKELYLHPELNLGDAEEKIVVFMLTGMERFDFIHNDFSEHTHFKTIWPFTSGKNDLYDITNSYAKDIYNKRFGAIELILNILDVKTWCKANNAKLILTSAFTPDYKRNDLIRKIRGEFNKDNRLFSEMKRIESLVDEVPWNLFFYPDKHNSFSDFLLKMEGREDLITPHSSINLLEYAKKFDKFTNKGYFTKCGHPSEKGQSVIAQKIYEHIKKLNYI